MSGVAGAVTGSGGGAGTRLTGPALSGPTAATGGAGGGAGGAGTGAATAAPVRIKLQLPAGAKSVGVSGGEHLRGRCALGMHLHMHTRASSLSTQPFHAGLPGSPTASDARAISEVQQPSQQQQQQHQVCACMRLGCRPGAAALPALATLPTPSPHAAHASAPRSP